MEQFKQLKWSWDKYEAEKNHPPRDFSFDTIHDGDVLARTLNEIHKCVVPKNKEFRVFRTAEEVVLGSGQFDDGDGELKDPRKNPTRFLKSSHELIRDYAYVSELSIAEQRTIMNGIMLKINHNPKFLIHENRISNRRQLTMSPKLLEKHKTEAVHFNKCAEVFYYRHMNDLSTLISDDMKKSLIDHWKSIDDTSSHNFQLVTMLFREQSIDGSIELSQEPTSPRAFNSDMYLTSDQRFPILSTFSPSDLRFYKKSTNTIHSQSTPQPHDIPTCDVNLTLNLMSKLVINTEQFTVRFTNHKSDGKMLSSFHEPMPLRAVSVVEALDEIVGTAIHASIDRWNMEISMGELKGTCEGYKIEKVEEVMRKMYENFKKKAGLNDEGVVWKMAKADQQEFRIFLNNRNIYFTKNDEGATIRVNISVKLECQTKFGAESMTKEELLREWCMMRFSEAMTLRYRVDVKTFEVLSISLVSLQEIESELKSKHDLTPTELLSNLFNIFACTQRLPDGEFLIQAKIDGDCKKLYIYREFEDGKPLNADPYKISVNFDRKWIPIDELTPTFLHLNHNFAPACFASRNKFQKLSYIPTVAQNKKIEMKAATKVKNQPKKKFKKKKKKKNLKKIE